jgi:urease beta subunit
MSMSRAKMPSGTATRLRPHPRSRVTLVALTGAWLVKLRWPVRRHATVGSQAAMDSGIDVGLD